MNLTKLFNQALNQIIHFPPTLRINLLCGFCEVQGHPLTHRISNCICSQGRGLIIASELIECQGVGIMDPLQASMNCLTSLAKALTGGVMLAPSTG